MPKKGQPRLADLLRMIATPPETTALPPREEAAFQMWALQNGIRDVDHPESRYDYRGYWKDIAARGGDATKMYDDGLHFPDTYKQHGHPSFSVESQYSRGLDDGGQWLGETLIPPPVPSHRRGR